MYLNGWSFLRIRCHIFLEMMIVMSACALLALVFYNIIVFPLIAEKQLVGTIVYQSKLYIYSWIVYFAIMVIGCFSCANRIITKCRKRLILYLEEQKIWE